MAIKCDQRNLRSAKHIEIEILWPLVQPLKAEE